MSLSYSEIKKKKKPVLEKVWIALDGEKADEFNEARVEFESARDALDKADNPRDPKLKKAYSEAKEAYEALLEEMEGEVVQFVFRSIGREKFELLVNDNPATPKQKSEAAKRGEDEPVWNVDTFPPALLAEASVSPELSEEDAFDLWNDENWNQAELMSLFMSALLVNQERKVAELGKGSGRTLG